MQDRILLVDTIDPRNMLLATLRAMADHCMLEVEHVPQDVPAEPSFWKNRSFSAVVINGSVPDPVRNARTAFRQDPALQIVFVSPNPAALRNRFGNAAMFGDFWSIVSPHPMHVERAVLEAVAATTQRRRYRTSLQAAARRLSRGQ